MSARLSVQEVLVGSGPALDGAEAEREAEVARKMEQYLESERRSLRTSYESLMMSSRDEDDSTPPAEPMSPVSPIYALNVALSPRAAAAAEAEAEVLAAAAGAAGEVAAAIVSEAMAAAEGDAHLADATRFRR